MNSSKRAKLFKHNVINICHIHKYNKQQMQRKHMAISLSTDENQRKELNLSFFFSCSYLLSTKVRHDLFAFNYHNTQ